MNKKGLLLAKETLKIILAVIAIFFLVYFLVSLYVANQDAKDLERAKAALPRIVEQLNGGAQEINLRDLNAPEDWYFITLPPKGGGDYPTQCFNLGWTSCICLCRDFVGVDYLITSDAVVFKCNEMGICQANPAEYSIVNDGNDNWISVGEPYILGVNGKVITR